MPCLVYIPRKPEFSHGKLRSSGSGESGGKGAGLGVVEGGNSGQDIFYGIIIN